MTKKVQALPTGRQGNMDLEKRLEEIVYQVNTNGANDVWQQERGARGEGDELEPQDAIKQLKQLFKEMVEEIIGEDDPKISEYLGFSDENWERNKLRAEMRQKAKEKLG